jgi:hypothetical protein
MCDPASRVTERVAVLPVRLTDPDPSGLPLSLNVTVPVGVGVADETVAVRLSDCPRPEKALGEKEVIAVIVEAGLMVPPALTNVTA